MVLGNRSVGQDHLHGPGQCPLKNPLHSRIPGQGGGQILSEDQAVEEESGSWGLPERRNDLATHLSREKEMGSSRIVWRVFILEKLCRKKFNESCCGKRKPNLEC